MAREIEKHVSTSKSGENLLGCTGHVFNLAAVEGLKILGFDARDDLVTIEEDEERETDVFYFYWGKEQEDNSDDNFDPSSIVGRVREICEFVRASPQRRKQFEECVKVCYSASIRESDPSLPATPVQIVSPATATKSANGKDRASR